MLRLQSRRPLRQHARRTQSRRRIEVVRKDSRPWDTRTTTFGLLIDVPAVNHPQFPARSRDWSDRLLYGAARRAALVRRGADRAFTSVSSSRHGSNAHLKIFQRNRPPVAVLARGLSPPAPVPTRSLLYGGFAMRCRILAVCAPHLALHPAEWAFWLPDPVCWCWRATPIWETVVYV